MDPENSIIMPGNVVCLHVFVLASSIDVSGPILHGAEWAGAVTLGLLVSELLHQVLVLLCFFLEFAVISGIGGVAYLEYVDGVFVDGCFPSLPCKLGEALSLVWLEALNNHDVRSHFPEVLAVCVGEDPLWYSHPLSS